MSNRTYICVECRTSKRAEAAGGLETPLRCSCCGGSLWELSHKWRIPKKVDDRAWLELRKIVADSKPVRKEQVQKRGSDFLRRIDWQIGVVSAQKDSQRRQSTLKKLQRERADVLLRYFPKTVARV